MKRFLRDATIGVLTSAQILLSSFAAAAQNMYEPQEDCNRPTVCQRRVELNRGPGVQHNAEVSIYHDGSVYIGFMETKMETGRPVGRGSALVYDTDGNFYDFATRQIAPLSPQQQQTLYKVIQRVERSCGIQ